MRSRFSVLALVLGLLGLVVVAPVHAGRILLDGDPSLTYSAPHHGPGNAGHSPETHYFIESGDAHHLAWGSATPGGGPTNILYDFRAIAAFTGGSANVITAAQKANAVAAFALWSAATDVGFGPNLTFTQSTVAALSSIINVGTGPVGPFGGLGGGFSSMPLPHIPSHPVVPPNPRQ